MTLLYGLKNCDKCRAASKWLAANGIKHRLVDIREEPIGEAQLQNWLSELGFDKFINKRSTTWKQLSESERDGLSEASAIALVTKHPALIKRPVLETAGGVYNGFTEASFDAIFKQN